MSKLVFYQSSQVFFGQGENNTNINKQHILFMNYFLFFTQDVKEEFKPIATNLKIPKFSKLEAHTFSLETQGRKIINPSLCLLCSLGLKSSVALDVQERPVPTRELNAMPQDWQVHILTSFSLLNAEYCTLNCTVFQASSWMQVDA